MLIRVHFIALLLALADLFLCLLWGISFRGQFFDILLSFIPFITAVAIAIKKLRSLPLAGRIYFIAMPIINLLLTPVYLFGTIFYPLPTLATSGNYEARSRMGVLSPPAANLIHKWGPFETIISPNFGYDFDRESSIKIVFKTDSVGLLLPVYKDSAIVKYFGE